MKTRKSRQAPSTTTVGDLARRTLRAAFWNSVGLAGRHARDWGAVLLGLSAILPVGLTALALAMARRHKGQPTATPWVALTALELALVGILGLLSVLDGLSLSRAEAGAGGGLIRWGIATALGDSLGSIGRATVLRVA